ATTKNGLEEKALAGEAIYNLKESKIILSKDNPIIIRGRDSISGRKVTVWLNQERMVVDKNSKIILSSMRTGEFKQAAGKASTVVTSELADLDYGKNVLSFDGKVQVKNPQMSLDCQQMKIFMEEKPQDKTQPAPKATVALDADPFNNLQNSGKKKEVAKVVCTGNVLVDDPRAVLNCDKMTILMRDKLKKNTTSKVEDSPFGAGSGREIYELLCDGNVRIENKPDKSEQNVVAPEKEKIEGVQSVLKAKSIGKSFVTADKATLKIADNYAELLGKVKIDEPRMNLTCQKMMIYGKEMTAGKKPEAEDIEDEPYEGEVPRQISLGANKELTKIICLKDVIINRKTLEEEKQRATGEKAVYTVDQRKIVLSGDDKNFPTMQRGETAMEGDEITLWTNSEKLDIKNGRLKQAEKLK
ncbi:MAG: LptA/OstA family protein, partial [Victivallaceae bacterium]